MRRFESTRIWLAFALLLVGQLGPGLPAGTVAASGALPTHQRSEAEAQPPGARQVTDETGRSLRLPDRIERIISLAPNLTEIIYALGAEDRLVGVTDYCDFPEAARTKPRVGSVLNPSIEQIVALKPDLVLATAAGNRVETVATLETLGISVYATNPRTVEGILASIVHVGELLGENEAASRVVAGLRDRLHALSVRLNIRAERESASSQPEGERAALNMPRVLFVVWEDPLISAGGETFVSDAIARAGGRSITANFSADWPRISLESALKEQPDFLVFAYHGAPAEKAAQLSIRLPELKRKPGWREFRAVREGKVILVSDTINRPSPRLFDALEELARALHPLTASVQAEPEVF